MRSSGLIAPVREVRRVTKTTEKEVYNLLSKFANRVSLSLLYHAADYFLTHNCIRIQCPTIAGITVYVYRVLEQALKIALMDSKEAGLKTRRRRLIDDIFVK